MTHQRVLVAPEQVERLDQASALPTEYPGWMVDFQHRDRDPNRPPPQSS